MAIGKQPFQLPTNTVKKETSIIDLLHFESHDDNNNKISWETVIDRRTHTASVKIKLFVIGFRRKSTVGRVDYIGKWIEIEPLQFALRPHVVFQTPPTIIEEGFFIGFFPYVDGNNLHIRLELWSSLNINEPSEMWIEKISIQDSEFDSNVSWTQDEDLRSQFFPPLPTDPQDPQIPVIPDPDPNNTYILG